MIVVRRGRQDGDKEPSWLKKLHGVVDVLRPMRSVERRVHHNLVEFRFSGLLKEVRCQDWMSFCFCLRRSSCMIFDAENAAPNLR
jgi:hypothetical protein